MFGKKDDQWGKAYGLTEEETRRDKAERERYTRAKRAGYSSYYHKYFEGYTEQKVLGKKGKTHIERVYVGDIYVQDGSDRRWVLQKILFFVLYFGAAMAAVIPNAVSWTRRADWYLNVCLALDMLMLIVMLYTLIGYGMAERRLTVWGYKEAGRVKTYSKLTAYIFAATFLMQLLYVILNRLSGVYLLPLVFTPIAAALFYLIHYVENSLTTYTLIPYAGRIPDGSVVIE